MVKISAEIRAAPGMVSTHATTMFSATPQRTADNRLADPTPEIAPVITCVFETGTPMRVAINIFAFKRSNEGAVQFSGYLVGDIIAFVSRSAITATWSSM
jgi:hypothetical protein